eukprot:scaffold206355_cov50-Prasinocladus_malaysianus.AAC.2
MIVKMGMSGLYFATSLAALPLPVKTTMSFALILDAALTALEQMDSNLESTGLWPRTSSPDDHYVQCAIRVGDATR